MANFFRTLNRVSPAFLGLAIALSTATGAVAQTVSNDEVLDQINQYGTEDTNGSMGQGVPGAAQFTDVSPNDWAYQALDDLVRRYDCLKGYPNGTYRGGRALSRYEFAAGLNACLQQIERLIAASTADFVTRSDLEALQRLIQEFEAELATLGTRVDALEGRVAFLEDHQFSTTTKLAGEVIFAATSDFSDGTGNASGAVDSLSDAVFGDRVRLELNTSFTGEDRLVTRLATGNLAILPTIGSTTGFEGTQTFNLNGDSTNSNRVNVDWLAYYFPFGNSQAYVAATGGIWSDFAPTLNPYFEDYDGGNGALSTFASENPIYRIGGGTGAALSFGFTPIESILGPSTVTLGYFAGNASDPSEGAINSDYAMLGQLNANVSDRFGLGLTFVHAYHTNENYTNSNGVTTNATNSIFGSGATPASGLVGTSLANNPASLFDNGLGSEVTSRGTVTNSFGAEMAFRPSDSISISGFASLTQARLISRGDAEIWTFGGGIAFPDLGKEGSVLGIFGGAQPTLRGIEGVNVNNALFDKDFSWHIEAFYKYQLSDNISITPGVIWLTDPNQGPGDSSDAVIGTLRTTFSF
ncbi:iron uptake porin [Spirulina major CS-329]|uniref:iron uptake porin n=1 Tax=Spirulina TaxID=1154 RepID=UPI00232E6F72|nr:MULTISPECIES: iron uptake porin [Spirulina]MDB9493320.1 iron uptake porin [Spirulina subsalsa CS-330]MDB9504486.1 iron uptake porin [Spirulina major CS-329]